MRIVGPQEVHASAVEALGLDRDALDLGSLEAISCSLRRAAGFLCPCPERTLVHAVVEAARHLADDAAELRKSVANALDALIAHGDLLELAPTRQDERGATAVLLFLAAPAYVVRESGALLLLGVAPDNASVLPEQIEAQLECVNHSRLLPPSSYEKYAEDLKELGLMEIPSRAWLRTPAQESAPQHFERMSQLLSTTGEAGDIPGLTVIDPRRDVHFYPRRWVEANKFSGMFVGRRSQSYGANVWCFVALSHGVPSRAVDLPLKNSAWRGCDEAWRLQAAIDANRGVPQPFRIREGPNDTRLIDFFSPVPMWVQRRLDAVGNPSLASGCLFSYKVKEEEVPEEVRFLEEYAWLRRE